MIRAGPAEPCSIFTGKAIRGAPGTGRFARSAKYSRLPMPAQLKGWWPISNGTSVAGHSYPGAACDSRRTFPTRWRTKRWSSAVGRGCFSPGQRCGILSPPTGAPRGRGGATPEYPIAPTCTAVARAADTSFPCGPGAGFAPSQSRRRRLPGSKRTRANQATSNQTAKRAA
jgi:hypothetical protein